MISLHFECPCRILVEEDDDDDDAIILVKNFTIIGNLIFLVAMIITIFLHYRYIL